MDKELQRLMAEVACGADPAAKMSDEGLAAMSTAARIAQISVVQISEASAFGGASVHECWELATHIHDELMAVFAEDGMERGPASARALLLATVLLGVAWSAAVKESNAPQE